VIGCRETSRPVKGEEIVEPAREELGLLFPGSELPGGHLHQVWSQGPEYSYGDVDGVDDEEIGKDQQVSADIGHMPRLLLAELSHQPCADRGDLFLVLFAKKRAPAGDRAASDAVVF